MSKSPQSLAKRLRAEGEKMTAFFAEPSPLKMNSQAEKSRKIRLKP